MHSANTIEVDSAHSCVGVWRWDARTTHGQSGLPVSAGCHECREQTQGRAIESQGQWGLRLSETHLWILNQSRTSVSKNSYWGLLVFLWPYCLLETLNSKFSWGNKRDLLEEKERTWRGIIKLVRDINCCLSKLKFFHHMYVYVFSLLVKYNLTS